MLLAASLVTRHQIFRARPAALSKNRVHWALGRNHTSVCVSTCCRTNQIAQVCVITNSQLANFLAPKQTLLAACLVADNVAYHVLATCMLLYVSLTCNLMQNYYTQKKKKIKKINTYQFTDRCMPSSPQGAREKFGLGTRLQSGRKIYQRFARISPRKHDSASTYMESIVASVEHAHHNAVQREMNE